MTQLPSRDADDLSHQSHRQLIGYLGILLPLILILLAGLRPTPGLPRWEPLNSMQRVLLHRSRCTAFVGILFALALFLFTYRRIQAVQGRPNRGYARW